MSMLVIWGPQKQNEKMLLVPGTEYPDTSPHSSPHQSGSKTSTIISSFKVPFNKTAEDGGDSERTFLYAALSILLLNKVLNL